MAGKDSHLPVVGSKRSAMLKHEQSSQPLLPPHAYKYLGTESVASVFDTRAFIFEQLHLTRSKSDTSAKSIALVMTSALPNTSIADASQAHGCFRLVASK
jgi:hypothetical protein